MFGSYVYNHLKVSDIDIIIIVDKLTDI
uniref:Nucleotidyltransferase domain-containing protein n=1 Tax=Ignisphaera aggregans TaxID=334771 RepID=A0A7C5UW15_9CREN